MRIRHSATAWWLQATPHDADESVNAFAARELQKENQSLFIIIPMNY
jgi:hypothetical protein